MNKKLLTIGLVGPLMAAGAIAAPATSASAAPAEITSQHRTFNRVHTDLDARAISRRTIRVVFRLDADNHRNRNFRQALRQNRNDLWRIRIEQNGRTIEREVVRARGGEIRLVEFARNTPGPDRFRSLATNLRTGRTYVDYDFV